MRGPLGPRFCSPKRFQRKVDMVHIDEGLAAECVRRNLGLEAILVAVAAVVVVVVVVAVVAVVAVVSVVGVGVDVVWLLFLLLL